VHIVRNTQVSDHRLGRLLGIAYPGIAESPEAFDRVASFDFTMSPEFDRGATWEDCSPAYALGLLTYEAYYREVTWVKEDEMRRQWEELRGTSRLSWRQAQAVVVRAWKALASLERAGKI
jgi:hypothetical protein